MSTTPEQNVDGAEALTQRSLEMIKQQQSGDDILLERVWSNLSFQIATVILEQAGCKITRGSDATAYLALVLATVESETAQLQLETAASDPQPSGG